MQPAQRYKSLTTGGWQVIERTPDQDWKWVTEFKNTLPGLYGGGTFAALEPVADLGTLLSASDVRRIHYPRSGSSSQADGKNYEWFIGNKRNQEGHGPGKGQWLELPQDKTKPERPLRRVDKDGRDA